MSFSKPVDPNAPEEPKKKGPEPVVPFVVPDRKLRKDQCVKFEIFIDPSKPDTSSTVERCVAYINNSSKPIDWIEFRESLEVLFPGQNVEQPEDKARLVKMMLKGKPLNTFSKTFDSIMEEEDLDANDAYEGAIEAVAVYIFPCYAKRKQKKYLKTCRKPKDMKSREWVSTHEKRNDESKYYPNSNGSKIFHDEAELTDQLEEMIPNYFKKQMALDQFDTTEKDIEQFVEACERIETAEAFEDKNKASSGDNNKKKRKNNGERNGKRQKNLGIGNYQNDRRQPQYGPKTWNRRKYCTLCEKYGHDLNTCTIAGAQVNRMKAAWKAGNATSRAEMAKVKAKQDLYSLMDIIVDEEEPATIKRKAVDPPTAEELAEEEQFIAEAEQFEDLTISDNSEEEDSDE